MLQQERRGNARVATLCVGVTVTIGQAYPSAARILPIKLHVIQVTGADAQDKGLHRLIMRKVQAQPADSTGITARQHAWRWLERPGNQLGYLILTVRIVQKSLRYHACFRLQRCRGQQQ
ncbi:hypothetical protein QF022_003487 [Vogesella perlucida]|nr:hypothetical protein [Vogesella perlucida]